eukprot:1863836-Amphidinium_carterae.1
MLGSCVLGIAVAKQLQFAKKGKSVVLQNTVLPVRHSFGESLSSFTWYQGLRNSCVFFMRYPAPSYSSDIAAESCASFAYKSIGQSVSNFVCEQVRDATTVQLNPPKDTKGQPGNVRKSTSAHVVQDSLLAGTSDGNGEHGRGEEVRANITEKNAERRGKSNSRRQKGTNRNFFRVCPTFRSFSLGFSKVFKHHIQNKNKRVKHPPKEVK